MDERTRHAHQPAQLHLAGEHYGISRKPAYEWLDRWRTHGPEGLRNRSSQDCPCVSSSLGVRRTAGRRRSYPQTRALPALAHHDPQHSSLPRSRCPCDAREPGVGTPVDPIPWPTCPTEAGAPTSRVSSGPETDVTAIRSPSRTCTRVFCSTVAGASMSASMALSQSSRASSVSSGYPSGSAQTTVRPSPPMPSAASPGSRSGSSNSGSCPISSSPPAPTRTESTRTCTSSSSAVRPGHPDPTCEPSKELSVTSKPSSITPDLTKPSTAPCPPTSTLPHRGPSRKPSSPSPTRAISRLDSSAQTAASAGTPGASRSAGSSQVMTSASSRLTTASSTSTSVPSGSVDSLNPNTASLTPSAEGKEELVAPTKDGELLPRSLDLTVTQVLYWSLSASQRSLKPACGRLWPRCLSDLRELFCGVVPKRNVGLFGCDLGTRTASAS